MKGSSGSENVNYYYYLNLIHQEERICKFHEAIRSLSEGKRVVEIGAGLGTYSFFAAAKALEVYAIEMSDIIRVAERLARENGLDQKISFIQGTSRDVSLPERCDLLILENFSSLFLRRDLEEVILDARARFLKQEAKILPQAVSLYAAPVQDEETWQKCCYFKDSGTTRYGLDFSLLKDMMLSNPHVVRFKQNQLLASPHKFLTLDLLGSKSFLFDQAMNFQIEEKGRVFGIAAWFDLHLTEELELSNAPHVRRSTWGQVLFPAVEPLEVEAGDSMKVRLACARAAETRDIWWSWQASLPSGVIDQSSFKGIAFWPGEFE